MKVRQRWKQKIGILLFCIGLCGVQGCSSDKKESFQELELQQSDEKVASEVTESEPCNIFVYICGSVVSPGVYELSDGARVYEAIEHAGGFKEEAAQEAINQAEKVTDGQQIYIPTKEEVEAGETEVSKQWVGGDSSLSGKVNINTASKDELMTLSGIGDSRAESIIAYRESNGPFQSVEELMNVEGIKEGVFNKIRDQIAL